MGNKRRLRLFGRRYGLKRTRYGFENIKAYQVKDRITISYLPPVRKNGFYTISKHYINVFYMGWKWYENRTSVPRQNNILIYNKLHGTVLQKKSVPKPYFRTKSVPKKRQKKQSYDTATV